MTFDNGSEFAHHETIANALCLQTYFAHPYSPWERGRNENTNGLLRQYLPKGTSFANQINNRPRKNLGYRKPNDIFTNRIVALGT